MRNLTKSYSERMYISFHSYILIYYNIRILTCTLEETLAMLVSSQAIENYFHLSHDSHELNLFFIKKRWQLNNLLITRNSISTSNISVCVLHRVNQRVLQICCLIFSVSNEKSIIISMCLLSDTRGHHLHPERVIMNLIKF